MTDGMKQYWLRQVLPSYMLSPSSPDSLTVFRGCAGHYPCSVLAESHQPVPRMEGAAIGLSAADAAMTAISVRFNTIGLIPRPSYVDRGNRRLRVKLVVLSFCVCRDVVRIQLFANSTVGQVSNLGYQQCVLQREAGR